LQDPPELLSDMLKKNARQWGGGRVRPAKKPPWR
jgi:hypothetical protein